jgi:hypothetical protein
MDREESLTCAIEAFKNGEFKSLRATAKAWNVSRSTLSYRLHGGQSCHDAHVAQQACSKGEEQALIQWINDWAAQGFPVRFDMVKCMAKHLILHRSGLGRRETISFRPLSHSWVSRFIARHKHLQSHIVRLLEVPRGLTCTHENFEKWFEVVCNATEKYEVDYHNVYNIDETGFRLGATNRMYAIVDKRQGIPDYSGEAACGESLTVIECACADGLVIPPFVIFKGENIQGTWISEAAPSTWMIATSPKGWTSNVLGMTWLRRQFDPHTKVKAKGAHRILILDGHGSHLTPDFIEYCRDNKIILLCLPPHTSHMLQPLDVSVFSPLKHWFKRECENRLRMGDIRVSKSDFLDIYHKTRPQALTEKNVRSGYRKSGLIPFNPAAVLSQLPLAAPTPPRPIIPVPQSTPKNVQQFETALDSLNNFLGQEVVDSEELKMLREKLTKAATTWTAEIDILRKDNADFFHHSQQKQQAASRKRKRIPGGQAYTLEEVRNALKTPQHPTQERHLRPNARRTRVWTPPEMPEEHLTDIEESIGSDINDCIVVVAPKRR